MSAHRTFASSAADEGRALSLRARVTDTDANTVVRTARQADEIGSRRRTGSYTVQMIPGGGARPASYWKDGEQWRIGTDADIAWIKGATEPGLTITSAIPPVFAAYATMVVPDTDEGRSEQLALVLRLLTEQSRDQAWWLGYLDTGADDLVFPDAPRVTLYAGWQYVLVQAGPAQAARWRHDPRSWRAPGPDLIFPADRSWLLSWLWDDDWRCLGGPAALVDRFVGQARSRARKVDLGEDPTPPGYEAR
ncbi:hypothetical protein [Phytohabitans kaempferiae]|uniref:Uncharacterized protein n=1 Tax=Phytohabitans kaempferiae TaxID=1620943 RepID=A0ABV6M4T5_9ACTN